MKDDPITPDEVSDYLRDCASKSNNIPDCEYAFMSGWAAADIANLISDRWQYARTRRHIRDAILTRRKAQLQTKPAAA